MRLVDIVPPKILGWDAFKNIFHILKCKGIGAALLALGIQLSVNYGYGGTIYLKAKTSELREYYIRNFEAIPFSHADPFMLRLMGRQLKACF